MRITYSMDILAPIERTFEFVCDHDKQKLWMDGLVETVYDTPFDGDNPIGTKFRQRIREAAHIAEYDGEILDFRRPDLMTVSIGDGLFRMEVCYSLARIDNGTRLDYSADMIIGSPYSSLMNRLLTLFTKRVLERQMRRLKEITERSI